MIKREWLQSFRLRKAAGIYQAKTTGGMIFVPREARSDHRAMHPAQVRLGCKEIRAIGERRTGKKGDLLFKYAHVGMLFFACLI